MTANVFRQEFRMHLRSVLTWSVAMVALIGVYGSLFSSFAQDAELLNQMMERFPKPLLAAFGMDGIDLASVLGYFSLTFLFVQICLAIQAANYGFSLVSVEEREWTADFLLTKPVGRVRILTSKLLAAGCGLTLTNAVVWISSFGTLEAFRGGRPYESGRVLLLLGTIVLFQAFFLGVGLVVSLLVKRVRNVTSYSMALAFGMYLLGAFGDMLGESALEKLTPFKHFDPTYAIQNGTYDLPLVLASVVVAVTSLVAAYVLYTRRDIRAVV